MEIKVKYQYSYFLYPYIIAKEKYDKYINGLINNKKCKIKIFEKEKDIDIYTYFNSEIRKKYFQTFDFTKEERRNENEIINKVRKQNCIIFDYSIGNNAQGKIGEENGIFFKIPKMEIICFNTGVCFVSIKTHLEGSEDFKNVLNFNYKFRDINSEFSKLKEYDHINIQTDSFNDIKDIKRIIQEITDYELENRRFFTHTYACIDSEYWNAEVNKVENEFLKYAYTYPSNYDVNFEKDKLLQRINKWKNIKIAGTKQCFSLLTNNLETANYTRLPEQFENEYLYTLIFNLYKKEYLQLLKDNVDNIKVVDEFEQFAEELLREDLTDDETGCLVDEMWQSILGINKSIEKIRQKIEYIDKNIIIKRYRKTSKILGFVLLASLILNLINLLMII
ncbi:MAG: hypothetical protein FWF46_09010 [Oscillospiraceae bacterium]|nr:hypothetical protein [Oscillospiraceae bacterium]